MIEKILERLESELKLADKEKERCSRENPLQFDTAKGYVNGISNTIEIVQEVAKEYEDKANEAREDFMEIVYAELDEDADNNRANRIIEAFDTYAPYQKGSDEHNK